MGKIGKMEQDSKKAEENAKLLKFIKRKMEESGFATYGEIIRMGKEDLGRSKAYMSANIRLLKEEGLLGQPQVGQWVAAPDKELDKSTDNKVINSEINSEINEGVEPKNFAVNGFGEISFKKKRGRIKGSKNKIKSDSSMINSKKLILTPSERRIFDRLSSIQTWKDGDGKSRFNEELLSLNNDEVIPWKNLVKKLKNFKIVKVVGPAVPGKGTIYGLDEDLLLMYLDAAENQIVVKFDVKKSVAAMMKNLGDDRDVYLHLLENIEERQSRLEEIKVEEEILNEEIADFKKRLEGKDMKSLESQMEILNCLERLSEDDASNFMEKFLANQK
jgi:hypothetical protein